MEIKETDILKTYATIVYEVFDEENITTEQFIDGVKKLIKTKRNSELYRRPSALDLIEMMELKVKQIDLTLEQEVQAQWQLAIDRGNYNDITSKVIDRMDNNFGSFYWRFNPENNNREPLNFLKKEFTDLYLGYKFNEIKDRQDKLFLNKEQGLGEILGNINKIKG